MTGCSSGVGSQAGLGTQMAVEDGQTLFELLDSVPKTSVVVRKGALAAAGIAYSMTAPSPGYHPSTIPVGPRRAVPPDCRM
jgi:hypothetical protein